MNIPKIDPDWFKDEIVTYVLAENIGLKWRKMAIVIDLDTLAARYHVTGYNIGGLITTNYIEAIECWNDMLDKED